MGSLLKLAGTSGTRTVRRHYAAWKCLPCLEPLSTRLVLESWTGAERFVRMALRHLPWYNPLELPPILRTMSLGLDTLERRRKIQQAVFVAKLINGEIDCPQILSLLDFRASQRSLRSTGLLQPRFHRTTFGSNESITACIRTFSTAEHWFEFGEPSRMFLQKVSHCFA